MSWEPPTGWNPPAQPVRRAKPPRPSNPFRRRLGWGLAAAAVLLLVVLVPTAGVPAYRTITSFERTTMPGSVSVDCRSGDEWRVGPAVGRSGRLGPVTLESQGPSTLDAVTVTMRDVPIPVRPATTREQFEWFGTTYTAVATFTCPRNGRAHVAFSGPEGFEAAVFPSFGRVARSLAVPAVGIVVVLGLAIAGTVLAVRHRASRNALW